jgi:hypothetical protein
MARAVTMNSVRRLKGVKKAGIPRNPGGFFFRLPVRYFQIRKA